MSVEEIKEDLKDACNIADDDVNELDEIYMVFKKSGLDSEDFQNRFVAWRLNAKEYKSIDGVSSEMIRRFESFLKANMDKKKSTNQSKFATPKRGRDGTPLKGKGQLMTPRAKVQKLEYVLDSPASATFKDRRDSGKIIATLGGDIQPTMSDEIEIENLIDTKSYKLLSFDRRHIADEIAYFINERCEFIENRLGIVEQASYSMITDVPITVCGMIICEGSKGAEGVYLLRDGEQVQLEISELEGNSIFPGMICAVEGVNLTGKLIVVSKIYQLTDKAIEDEGVKEDTTVVICSGPYFTSDNTSNEPLEELITQVASLAPHLAIFMGPFLDQSHMGADCISVENLNELWKKQIDSLAQSGTKVRMIPSTADLFADPVIPTRAIDEKEFAYCREHMVSNPCFLAANKWNIAAISVDLPLSLMKTEIVKNPSNSCKFSRIGEHLLSQQCMMPLFPAPEEISVDYSKFKENICFEKQPNVLVVRSELNPFIKLVGNTIFINPGKLTKGKGGGSYATIQLNSSGHRAKIQKL